MLAPIAAAAAVASGLFSLAKINAVKLFAGGGRLDGPSHQSGGIPFTVGGQGGFEAEGGEVLINKRSAAAFAPQLSAINSYNGYGTRFADGGPIPSVSASPSIGQVTSQAAMLSKDMADYIINGINDKKVINDPLEALEAQDFSIQVVNEGSF